MKVGVLTLAYNEEQFIGAVLENWRGKVSRHVVLLSSKPWHGVELPRDKSAEICKHYGVEVISLPWPSETAQRNWGLGYLSDCDYVLQVDADELYEEKDQLTLLSALGTKAGEDFVDNTNCYRTSGMITYFKTPDYVLDPPDGHWPVVAINPLKATFMDCRVPSQDYQLVLPITMHHVSYLRNDLRLWHKMQQFEHYNQVRPSWFSDVWQKWEPGMANVRSYGVETSTTKLQPMPDEIRGLIQRNQELLSSLHR